MMLPIYCGHSQGPRTPNFKANVKIVLNILSVARSLQQKMKPEIKLLSFKQFSIYYTCPEAGSTYPVLIPFIFTALC